AGGIVFNNKGQVLVTQHSQNKHWSFPKGLIDSGQTPEEAALREVKEEGGVKAEIIDKIGYSKYIYSLNGEKIFKVVTYFLMKYISGDPKDHDWEVEEAGWYEPEDALKQLTFNQDKELLKKALEIYGK
ncbi:MAG: NUDIX hydrolase, partial [Patescibacteria group bacterium]